MFKKASLFFIFLFLPFNIYAQEVHTEQSTKDTAAKLLELKYHIDSVKTLQSKKLLTAAAAESEIRLTLKEAATLLNKPSVTQQELVKIVEKKGSAEQAVGFLNFVTIVKFCAILILAISLIWLSVVYIVPVIVLFPPKFKEAMFYSFSIVPVVLGKIDFISDVDNVYLGLLGSLGFIGALEYSYFSRKMKSRTALYAILTIVWGSIAALFNSSMIGFMSVGALLAFFGFSVLVTPLCYCIGFKNDEIMARTTMAAAILVLSYIFCEISSVILPPQVEIFKFGVLFLGTFVYFTGLLIMSSKFYSLVNDKASYSLLQLVTIVSGIGALFIGSVFDLDSLQKIGGTFFFLYLIEKYTELPWNSSTWPWLSLIFAGLLWCAARFASVYPTYFFFF